MSSGALTEAKKAYDTTRNRQKRRGDIVRGRGEETRAGRRRNQERGR
jgi:hypothetical protein